MGALHPIHLLVVLLVVLLVFGPKKLPELAKGVGESLKELKRARHSDPEADPESAPPP